MNKKIASELATGIILLLAIIVGVIFVMQNRQDGAVENLGKMQQKQPVKRTVEQPAPASEISKGDGQVAAACVGHLYEGEATLTGTYSLETIPGTTKKDWMFKVVKDDIDKLPAQMKTVNSENTNDLLFISDATPEMKVELKKATNKPKTVTIKGIYVDCEGAPIVSIEPARIALAKYIKN